MEKTDQQVQHLRHRQSVYNYKRRSPQCTQPRKKKTSHISMVWVPKIPTWEKEFCYKIGSFKWGDFLEAKKLIGFQNNVLEWDDSEAEQAFHQAKKRFFAKINNQPGRPDDYESNPDPDMYIDKNIEEEIIDDLEFDLACDEANENMNVVNDFVQPDYIYPCNNQIGIGDIEPEDRWDTDIKELSSSWENVLTGLVVGS